MTTTPQTNSASPATTGRSFVVKTTRGFVLESEDGLETPLPTKMEVCPRCHGHGKHDHPAFSNGITASEWNSDDWDDDSRESYFRGDYDVACEECGGNNVVSVPDEARMTEDQIEALNSYYRDGRSCRSEMEMERRMDC